MSLPVQPNNMDEQPPIRGSIVHSQQSDNQSKGNVIEDISRLQSATNAHSNALPYKIGDLVVELDVEYRCTIPIPIGKPFDILDWTKLGGGAAIVQEVGRLLVGANTNLAILTLTKITKYLRINFSILHAVDDIEIHMRFNGDDGSNYVETTVINFQGSGSVTGMDSINFGMSELSPNNDDDYSGEIFITNIANLPIVGNMRITSPNGPLATEAPYIKEGAILWANSLNQINSIEFHDLVTTGIGVGSEFIALGWD